MQTLASRTSAAGAAPGGLKQWLLDALPHQGHWSEQEYLWVTDHTNRLVEFTEYWIVNPHNETVMVLVLDGKEFVDHGKFGRGEIATSVVVSGFTVSVDAVFAVE